MMSRLGTHVAEASIARRRARIDRGRALRIERSRGPTRGAGLDRGDLVRHATWGDGEIVRVVGDNAVAVFPRHGERLLKASFLTKVAAR